MNRILLPCLGLLLFGLGYFVGDAPDPTEPVGPSLAPGLRMAPSSRSGDELSPERPFFPGPAVAEAEGATDTAHVERAVIQDAGWLAAARARLAPPRYPRGEGTIRGTCRTINGQPIAGALVRAFQEETNRERSHRPPVDPSRVPEVDEDLGEVVVHLLEQARRRRATLVETRTDGAGRYELRGLGDAEHRVQAFVDGHEAAIAQGSRARGVRPGEEVSFVAEPLQEVLLHVLLPDGSPADRANVWVRATMYSWSGENYQWTPAQPRLYLSPGRTTIGASRHEPGEPQYEAAGQDVYVAPGGGAQELTFRLVGKIRIEGTIQPEHPEDLRRRHPIVRALRYEGERAPDLTAGNTDGTAARAEVDGERWKYVFDALEPGQYAFGLYESGQNALQQIDLPVSESGRGPDFRLGEEDARLTIRVRVHDPDGHPLDRANFRWIYERDGRERSDGPSSRRLEDGTYLVRRPDPEDPALQGTLTVTHTLYGEVRRPVRPWADQELTFRFGGAATLRVNASSCVGTDLAERVRFELRSATEPDEQRVTRTDRGLDANGGRTMGPLQPGSYQLALQVDLASWSFRTVQELPVTLSVGERVLDVVFPPLHELVVVVPAELRGERGRARIAMYEERGGERGTRLARTNLDDDGRATFSHLTPGSYWLELDRAAEEGSMIVAVPGVTPVIFAARPMAPLDALRVEIEQAGGAFATAGLQSGDLIVGIGEHAFREPQQMLALFHGLVWTSDEPLTLHVLRGGARHALRVDPRPLRDGKGFGGKLLPAGR